MHQVSRTVNSITLSWSQPDQPNGVILDYELQYYEKVTLMVQLFSLKPSFHKPVWKDLLHCVAAILVTTTGKILEKCFHVPQVPQKTGGLFIYFPVLKITIGIQSLN